MLLRESLGISADGSEKAFSAKDVESMMLRKPPPIPYNVRTPSAPSTSSSPSIRRGAEPQPSPLPPSCAEPTGSCTCARPMDSPGHSSHMVPTSTRRATGF